MKLEEIDKDNKIFKLHAAQLAAFRKGGAVERLIKHLPGRCSGCRPIVAELEALLTPAKSGGK